MNTHIVLARKYRPQKLADIIGQDVLVTTLSNAIRLNRLPQAILLTGTRGIGKTTTARIIAKYLNCTDRDNNDCCNKCDDCLDISSSSHPDVLEFDAASKTSVDDIREILDNIKYKPIRSSKKVYIIDEVHMLSNSAFNALLKTLEEPPSHVMFIFATTEEAKLPLTIISRCLHFKLKPMSEQVIARQCKAILSSEVYSAEDGVIELVAKAANGSMRDALSILEGAISFCLDGNNKLSLQKALVMLGLEKKSSIEEIFHQLCSGNVDVCLEQIRNLYESGVETIAICSGLMDVVHQLTIKKISEHINIDMPFLLRSWHCLNETLSNIKTSDFAMMELEMCLIKLSYLKVLDSNSGDIIHHTPTQITSDKNINIIASSTVDVMSTLIERSQEDIPVVRKIKLLDPKNNFNEMADRIRSFNNLRVLLSFLLERGEAILYHRLSSVVKIVSIDLVKPTIVVSSGKDLKLIDKKTLDELTNADWDISYDTSFYAMTYSEFLSTIDAQHEKSVLKTDLVQCILEKFDDIKIDKVTINNN